MAHTGICDNENSGSGGEGCCSGMVAPSNREPSEPFFFVFIDKIWSLRCHPRGRTLASFMTWVAHFLCRHASDSFIHSFLVLFVQQYF